MIAYILCLQNSQEIFRKKQSPKSSEKKLSPNFVEKWLSFFSRVKNAENILSPNFPCSFHRIPGLSRKYQQCPEVFRSVFQKWLWTISWKLRKSLELPWKIMFFHGSSAVFQPFPVFFQNHSGIFTDGSKEHPWPQGSNDLTDSCKIRRKIKY